VKPRGAYFGNILLQGLSYSTDRTGRNLICSCPMILSGYPLGITGKIEILTPVGNLLIITPTICPGEIPLDKVPDPEPR